MSARKKEKKEKEKEKERTYLEEGTNNPLRNKGNNEVRAGGSGRVSRRLCHQVFSLPAQHLRHLRLMNQEDDHASIVIDVLGQIEMTVSGFERSLIKEETLTLSRSRTLEV